ncbi:MAG: hypothetical protein Q7J85_10150 [Bacillota bacterium]|nr:hypothetical protein [Bacillota bacterium]
MRKTIFVLLALALLVMGTSQAVLAFGGGNGRGPDNVNGCWLESISPEAKAEVTAIREKFMDKIAVLKEQFRSLRDQGQIEESREIRTEMWDLKEEMKEELRPYIPEEYMERFDSMGPAKRFSNRHQNLAKFQGRVR